MFDTLERYRWLVVALLAVPMIAAIAIMVRDRTDDPAPLVVRTDELPAADVRVYVTGAVVNPGVYPVSADARWIDAVEAAGGVSEDADVEAIDLARHVQDEQTIAVPRRDAGSARAAGALTLVNVNTADIEALEALPGVGEVRAESIITSRENDGPFAQIEDLRLRDLVPESVFADIAPLITVE